MSFDDDLNAIPTLCDSCFGKLRGTEPTHGIGWKALTFKCEKCKYEFCPHLQAADSSKLCVGCAEEIKAEHGPVDWM